MDKTQVQLFKNEYNSRCDTFSCGEPSKFFVGRPDAPLSTAMNLCQVCADQLVESVVEMYGLHAKSVHKPTQGVNGVKSAVVEGESVSWVDHADTEEDETGNVETLIDDELGEPDDVTLEEVLESLRTHAELDELAEELGVKGVPSREDATLKERKQYVFDNVPDGE